MSKQALILKRIHKTCTDLGMQQHNSIYYTNIGKRSIVLSLEEIKVNNLSLTNESSQLFTLNEKYSNIKSKLDSSKIKRAERNKLIKSKKSLKKLLRTYQKCVIALDTMFSNLKFVKRDYGSQKSLKWLRTIKLNTVIVATLQVR